jgi:hypothetical protein
MQSGNPQSESTEHSWSVVVLQNRRQKASGGRQVPEQHSAPPGHGCAAEHVVGVAVAIGVGVTVRVGVGVGALVDGHPELFGSSLHVSASMKASAAVAIADAWEPAVVQSSLAAALSRQALLPLESLAVCLATQSLAMLPVLPAALA